MTTSVESGSKATEEVSPMDSTLPTDGDISLQDLEKKEKANGNEHSYELDEILSSYGFSLAELFTLSVQFYKKGRKVLNLGYEDKLKLTAYWKQISTGSYDEKKVPEIGYLDVIGNDRRKAWQALGSMSSADAMVRFCTMLKEQCKEYIPFMEAQKKDREEKERIKREAQAKKEEEERKKKEEEERKKEEEEQRRLEEEERIRREKEEAARLEAAKEEARRKLKEQKALESQAKCEVKENTQDEVSLQEDQQNGKSDASDQKSLVYSQTLNGIGARALAPASLWTRPKLDDFISHVKRDASSVVVVGRGETVTIRVPTHENGSCLFWEFATDSYDVGFGVYFEWSTSMTQEVSVKVDESEDDSDYDITKEETADHELEPKPNVDEVLPVLRRNSHKEVIVGSHIYPGSGVYLLKFDNSYSLLRSKTLYYRVYYTR